MSTDFIGIAGQRTVEFCCDTCGETFDSEEETFREAAEAAKKEGWRARKRGDEWSHLCPGCTS